jgi:hypothetical protein
VGECKHFIEIVVFIIPEKSASVESSLHTRVIILTASELHNNSMAAPVPCQCREIPRQHGKGRYEQLVEDDNIFAPEKE